MAFPLRTRTRGRPGRNAGASSGVVPFSNPLLTGAGGWTTGPVHGVWASDPSWSAPADGGAVSSWRNGGSAYTTGAYIGADGLVLPGTYSVTNHARAPQAAVLRPSGDMEIIVKATATDWTPTASKALVTNGDHSGPWYHNYILLITNTGAIFFSRPTGSTARTYTSTVATGVTDGTAKWIKVSFDVDNGASASEVTFWLSDDGSSWTQLGDPVTGVLGAGNDNAAHAAYLYIGQAQYADEYPWAGTIHRTIIKDGIGGTTVYDASFSDATEGVSAFTESSSNAATVTVVNSQDPVQATGSKQPTYDAALAAFNNQPVVTFATDDVLAVDVADVAQPFWLVTVSSSTSGVVVGNGGDTTQGLRPNHAGAVLVRFGTTLTGGSADSDPHMFVATAAGASSAVTVDGAAVLSGNAGTAGITVLTLGAGNAGVWTYGNHLTGSIALCLIFTTDPTALPEWAAFKAWCLSFYGITVA